MYKTAIVILNYNGQDYLEKFLPGVIKNSAECRIIVADNCSTDNSVSFLKENFPTIEVIEIPFNKGYSSGYNYALKLVESEYYVLLNSDVEVTSNWVQPIVEFLDSREDVAACQPKICSYQEKEKFEYAGAAGGYIDKLGYPFCRGRMFATLETDHQQYNDTTEVFWATGACLFVRSSAFHEHGGLDEDYFAHMEEIDLCWRLKINGWKIFYNGESTVYHVGGGTLNSANPKKTYLNFRNGLAMLYANTPGRYLLYRVFLRLILDGIASIKFLFDSGWKHSFAVLKAHIHFYTKIRKSYKKRKAIRHLLKSDPTKMYQSLVVFDYFLSKRRTFRQLRFNKR